MSAHPAGHTPSASPQIFSSDFDSKYYFPKQSHASGEDTRSTGQEPLQMSSREVDYDVK